MEGEEREVQQSAMQPNSVPLLKPTTPTSHFALNERFCVTACRNSEGSILEVWEMENGILLKKYFLDLSLERKVTGLALGRPEYQSPLAVSTKKIVIVWKELSESSPFIDLGEMGGIVQHLAFDPTHTLLSVCVEKNIVIFELQKGRPFLQLDGQNFRVTSSAFFPSKSEWLISTSEDRTFRIWNLSKETPLVYQSSILSPSPLLSISVQEKTTRFAIGGEDGKLRFYEWIDSTECRQLFVLELSKAIKQLQRREDLSDSLSVNDSFPLFALAFAPLSRSGYSGDTHLLFVGSRDGLAVVDEATYSLLQYIPWEETNMPVERVTKADSISFSPLASKMFIGITSAFSPLVNLFQYSVEGPLPSSSSSPLNLSTFITQPIPPTSPLQQQLTPKVPVKSKSSKKPKGVVDQPLTFHSRIKSSGYGSSPPPNKLFSPSIPKKRSTPPKSSPK